MRVLGNKCQVDDEMVISEERGQNLATENGMIFFQTSSAENININEAFMAVRLE